MPSSHSTSLTGWRQCPRLAESLLLPRQASAKRKCGQAWGGNARPRTSPTHLDTTEWKGWVGRGERNPWHHYLTLHAARPGHGGCHRAALAPRAWPLGSLSGTQVPEGSGSGWVQSHSFSTHRYLERALRVPVWWGARGTADRKYSWQ